MLPQRLTAPNRSAVGPKLLLDRHVLLTRPWWSSCLWYNLNFVNMRYIYTMLFIHFIFRSHFTVIFTIILSDIGGKIKIPSSKCAGFYPRVAFRRPMYLHSRIVFQRVVAYVQVDGLCIVDALAGFRIVTFKLRVVLLCSSAQWQLQMVTVEFAVDLGSGLSCRKPTILCLWPVLDVFQSKIHCA
jgi:hypothetical protein